MSDEIRNLARKARDGFDQCMKLEGCDGCPYIPEEKAGDDCVGIMFDDVRRTLKSITEDEEIVRER